MFQVGGFRARTCGGWNRRAFLKFGASLPLAWGLAGANTAQATEGPRARSVILLWLWGAPSHHDTFDPKPDAPAEFRGPFAPIATRTSGLNFTELLPQLAQRSHLFNVVRSHATTAPGHPDAGTVALTGFAENPSPPQPNFGSIIAKHRGDRGSLPPFISLGRGIPRDIVRKVDGFGGGTLGKSYDPFLINCTEEGRVEIPALQLLDGLSPHRLDDRRTLLAQLDTAARTLDGTGIDTWEQNFQRAYGLLTEPAARRALDVTQESAHTRQKYGRTSFGQSCLLARRLVESHVPYIQVNWSEYVEAMTPRCDFGWDTHIYNFELLQDRHCPIFDRALSALLDDLSQRGLLEHTLVVAMGEFGRTPRINGRAARDHWPRCYSSLWAGAGVPGGRWVGESDRLGEDPLTRPLSPLMVGTTIAELAGVGSPGRAELRVLDGGEVIHELV